MSGKIIDVDFKKKRVNFTFEHACNKQRVDKVQLGLARVMVDIKRICKDDDLYHDWCMHIFSNILANLKGRE